MALRILQGLCIAIALHLTAAASLLAQARPPTFSKEVATILQKNCQSCHRPGEGGPFPLMTYGDAKLMSSSIKRVVSQKIMPPWYADPKFGHFSNDRSLSSAEIATLVAWVNGGAPEGDQKDLPPPINWVEGWGIPKPDVIFQLPKPFNIPASGTIDYQYVIIPTGFTEDKWVQMAEARPTNRPMVHHIIAYIREPGSSYFKDQKIGDFFVAPPSKEDEKADTSALPSDFLIGYAPGQPAEVLLPGQAKLIKAGSDLVLEVHYMAMGTATTDQARVGLIFAKTPPKQRVLTVSASNGTFKIPPGDPNYKVDATFDVATDVTLASIHPHMHTRGKDFEYRIVYPDGRTETILRVPKYNWRWQLWYNLAEPMNLSKGTKIECTAHFDNSADNPENPDPTKTVIWGQQSWDEMMVGFFNLVFDAKTPVRALYPEKKDHPDVAKN